MGLAKLVLQTNKTVYNTLSEANNGSANITSTYSTGSTTLISASTTFGTNKPYLSSSNSTNINLVYSYSSNVSTTTATNNNYFFIIRRGSQITIQGNAATNCETWSYSSEVGVSGECQYFEKIIEKNFLSYTGTFTFVGTNCLSSSHLTWIVPGKGTYTMELWGAEGGARVQQASVYGGRGGYVKASKSLDASTTVYMYIGGSAILDSQAGTGGWNGGGNAGPKPWSGGGGGGTDIRIGGNGDGYNTATDNRVLVAGGGGGASGGNENYDYLDGGTTNSGNGSYKFHGNDGPANTDGGGGGGGYQGGLNGIDGTRVACGGSNYVGSGWTTITNGRQSTVYGNGKINVIGTP